MTLAVIFNGQGAQYEGMGLDFDQQFPTSREVFDLSEAVTHYPIRQWIGEDFEELATTNHAQPAIMTVSLAIYSHLLKDYPQLEEAAFYAGLSLGEYTSLIASGMLSLEDGFSLIKERGQLMSQVCAQLNETQPVQMAAVLGMPLEEIESLVETIHSDDTPLYIANKNSSTQVIIAGVKDSIKAFRQQAKEAGYKKVMPLKVEGPFHSPLMQAVVEPYSDIIKKYHFKAGKVPVISNTTLELDTPDNVTELLVRHMIEPVRWQETIQKMQDAGVTHVLQIGPGQTLANLLKREPNAPEIYVVDTVADLEALDSFLQAAVK